MVAFPFRMGAGFSGDVNRTHPFTVEPTLNDPTNPSTFYGEAVLYTAAGNSVRTTAVADNTLTSISGISVRPFPQQPGSSSQPFGGTGTVGAPFGDLGAPVARSEIDVLKSGYIIVPVNGTPVKGGAVFVWVAASAAPHVHGTFEAAATAGSTIAIVTDGRTYFNGPPDANGRCELAFNI